MKNNSQIDGARNDNPFNVEENKTFEDLSSASNAQDILKNKNIDFVDANENHLGSIMAIYMALCIDQDLEKKIDPENTHSYPRRGGILKVPEKEMILSSIKQQKHFFRLAVHEGETKGFLWGCYDFSTSEPFYPSFMREGETTDKYSVYESFQKQNLVAYGMDLMIHPSTQRSSLGAHLYYQYALELQKRGMKKIIFMAEKLKSLSHGDVITELDMNNDATLRMHSHLGATLIKTIDDTVTLESGRIANRTCMYHIVDVDNILEVLGPKLGIKEQLITSQVRLDIIKILREILINKTTSFSPEEFTIRGIWDFNMRSQPRDGERVFTESGYLVATSGLGASFRQQESSQNIDGLIGEDGRYISINDKALEVAILDACFSSVPKEPSEKFVLLGDTVSKASQRASIVSREVKKIAEKYSINDAKVLMIGVVQTIVEEMEKEGLSTILSDLDPNLLNKEKEVGNPINNGNQNQELIPKCDIILVTGMTLATSTLDEIITTAMKYNKPVVVFAQTGSNLANEYLALGVETVVAEHYPWYCVPGKSTIETFRSEIKRPSETLDEREEIIEILNRIGTPAYIYDARLIRENAIKLKDAFKGRQVYYSVKANPNPEVCSILSKLGYEAEVVTEGEIQTAIESGFNAKKMLFAGPGKTHSQIKNAISMGISLFTAESINQLKLINHVADQENTFVNVLLRINLPELYNEKSESMMGGDSQFGLDINGLISEKSIFDTLKNVKIVGTQFYAASQILDPTKLAKSVKKQLEKTQQLMKEIPMTLEMLDIGGGFGIPYKNSESELDLDKCSELLEEVIISNGTNAKPEIIIESGRYLVGNAGTFYTKVIDVKESFGKYHIICDGGMVGFTRPMLVRSPHRIELFSTKSVQTRTETCVISGFSCSSLDTFDTVEMKLPEIGDVIAIKDAGAYGWGMSIKDFHCVKPPKEFVIHKESISTAKSLAA